MHNRERVLLKGLQLKSRPSISLTQMHTHIYTQTAINKQNDTCTQTQTRTHTCERVLLEHLQLECGEAIHFHYLRHHNSTAGGLQGKCRTHTWSWHGKCSLQEMISCGEQQGCVPKMNTQSQGLWKARETQLNIKQVKAFDHKQANASNVPRGKRLMTSKRPFCKQALGMFCARSSRAAQRSVAL